jgi:exo-beta-1,3-glucanase (GH17 family)
MKISFKTFIAGIAVIFFVGCKSKNKVKLELALKPTLTAATILGNSDYLAISYGGYRHVDHDIEPTIEELKEDLKLLDAMGIKILRTYKVHLPQASNMLKAISELKKEDSSFEMYLMLGAWIDCKNALTELAPDHEKESERNELEIATAVTLAKKYPDIVKVIAVGNEAMVKWQASYYVQPAVILKWVRHLQALKKSGVLSKDLWITSSDDFSSWGGGSGEYHTPELEKLINAVDYISMHSYAYHNSHYNPDFWGVPESEKELSQAKKVERAMVRAKSFTMTQYNNVKNYVASLGIDKPIHIGESGWATKSNGFYGEKGSRATDEYKQGLYYQQIRQWTKEEGISCFYFEAFDEPWKDAENPLASENHFGLINLKGEAKYPLWNLVDAGVFKGLTRNGKSITKTYNGDKALLMQSVLVPTIKYKRVN